MLNPDIHHRRSIRLKGYDYSQTGAYFVTICTHKRERLFGDINSGEMRINEYGVIAAESWIWLPQQYGYIDLDEWIVMPNHMHGILVIADCCRGGSRTAPTGTQTRKTLGRLIGAFKTVSSKQINLLRNSPGVILWQRNYYEQIIRNEAELNKMREYIRSNPLNWESDENFANRTQDLNALSLPGRVREY